MIYLTKDELYNAYYNNFKYDLSINTKDKSQAHIKDILKTYSEYMLELRDMMYKPNSDEYDAYTNALHVAKHDILN